MSLSFGAPSSAPASSSLAGGFSFGTTANKPTMGFGLGQPSTGLFGTPATSATTGFGAPAPMFGATTTPAFGSTATPAFGAPTPTFAGLSGTSLNFGAGSNTTTTSTGLGFGAPISSATSTGLNFAAPTSSAAPALGNFSFGAPASTSAPNLGFGLLGSTTAAPGLFDSSDMGVYPMIENPQVPNSSWTPITQTFQMVPSSNSTYKVIEATGAGNSTQCDYNENCQHTESVHLKTASRDARKKLSPLFGAKLGTTTASSQPTSSVSIGLGGISSSGIGAATDTSAASKGAEQQPKQQKLPNEIASTVEAFAELVKRQKALSCDVMRVSIKPLVKVSQQVEETIRAATALAGEAGRARAQARRLRGAAARALAAADQLGAECSQSGPPAFVLELMSELEARLLTFRQQMDVADRQMQAPQRTLTEQELCAGMKRLHGAMVGLAGRLQAARAQVQAERRRYLALRRHLPPAQRDRLPDDDSSILDVENSLKSKSLEPETVLSRAVLNDPRAVLGSLQQSTGPTPFNYLGNTLSSFSTADNTGVTWGQSPPVQPSFGSSLGGSAFATAGTANDTNSSSFQLQKPPKRGKQ